MLRHINLNRALIGRSWWNRSAASHGAVSDVSISFQEDRHRLVSPLTIRNCWVTTFRTFPSTRKSYETWASRDISVDQVLSYCSEQTELDDFYSFVSADIHFTFTWVGILPRGQSGAIARWQAQTIGRGVVIPKRVSLPEKTYFGQWIAATPIPVESEFPNSKSAFRKEIC